MLATSAAEPRRRGPAIPPADRPPGRPLRARASGWVVLLALALTACGGGPSGSATGGRPRPAGSAADSPPVAAGTDAARPAGCAVRSPVAGIYRRSLRSGGVRRSYLLEVPPAAGIRPLPLVLDFHGYDQTAAEQDAYTGLSAAAGRRGVYVVTPDGVDERWNFVRRAAVGPSDVAFLTTLLSTLSRTICYDPRRVVAAGLSDGADMADVFGCAHPGLVAAVFGVAPSVIPRPCPASPPTLIEVHGTADPVVPFAGGGGDRPFPFQGTEAVATATRMAFWARLNRCAAPVTATVARGVQLTRWPCPGGRVLALYAIEGGGHTWPGAPPRPEFGATTDAVSATTAVLSLARDPHRLPWTAPR